MGAVKLQEGREPNNFPQTLSAWQSNRRDLQFTEHTLGTLEKEN